MRRMVIPIVATIAMMTTGTRGFAQEALGPTPPPGLKVDPLLDGALAATALATWGIWGQLDNRLAPKTCRWCGTNGLDAGVRNALVWKNPGRADTISTVIAITVTAGSGVYAVLHTYAIEGTTEAAKNAVLWTEVVSVTGVLTQAMKYSAARARPRAYYGHATGSVQDNLSFWSGHAATVFSAVAATGTLARLRGNDDWIWLYAIGFTSAATMSYFRLSSDMHWLTDTLTGAAVGTTVGLVIPWLHRGGGGKVTFQVVPMADGLAVAGEF
jgi:membrane-associated phospholipid phosphatase